MRNPYKIHEAIARNAVIAFTEPGEDDQPMQVRRTCQEVILLGIERDKHMRATSTHAASLPIPSANSMLEDYLAIHWASIEPANVAKAQAEEQAPNAGAQAPPMPQQQAAEQASLCPSCGGMHGPDPGCKRLHPAPKPNS